MSKDSLTARQGIRQGFAMSEPTHVEIISKTTEAEPIPEEAVAHDSSSGKILGKFNPLILLIFMFVAALLVLAIGFIKAKQTREAEVLEPSIEALKAEVELGWEHLNQQRRAAGLAPLEANAEPMDEIAHRLKKDADALIALSKRFDGVLAEKNASIASLNKEIQRLEKFRESVSEENARLQAELKSSAINPNETKLLQDQLAAAKAQQTKTSAELRDALQQLAVANDQGNADDYADLQKRFEEALRAKDFFETRVKELEQNSIPAPK
jgi:DNA repair exonuclease SbcCD ATPase subunit